MSKRVKMIFPVPMSEATRPMVESQLPPEFRRSDIAVSFVGAGSTITLADSYYDMAIMELAVVIAGANALPSAFVVFRGFEESMRAAAERGSSSTPRPATAACTPIPLMTGRPSSGPSGR